MKKTFSFLLALCLLLSLLPVGAYAAETEPAAQTGETTLSGSADYTIEEGALPDGQELLDSYAQMLLYPQYSMSLFSLGPQGFQDSRQKYIYDKLKDWIKEVAAGQKDSHFVLTIPTDPSFTWSRSNDLNNAADDILVNEVFAALDINTIIDCLIADMPYELYWLGKSDESSVNTHISLSISGDQVSVNSLEMVFLVGESYRNTDPQKKVTWTGKTHYSYTVNAEKKAAAEKAVITAKNIVDSCKDLDDYKKLLEYKNRICALTDYDRNAVSSTPSLYGDPWQIINVFDDNADTKVVCEGYSKAFQYLCDLSTFNDAACYTAIGTLIGDGVTNGSAAHMWNIVRLEGKNYLVDVTNSDSENAGNQLFLAGAIGNPQEEYTVTFNSSNVKFKYDLLSDEMKNLMSQILPLSDTSYDPNSSTEPEPPVHEHSYGEWSYDETQHWHECTADGCGEKNDYAEHQFGEWTTVKEATATEDGSRERQCACGYKQTEPIPATGMTEPTHTHSWSSEWKYDDTHHWHECTADGCGEKNDYAEHQFGEWTTVKEATATEDGSRERQCACGYKQTEPIPATGMTEPTHTHSWSSDWKYDDNYHWHDCTADGCDITENSGKNGYAAHTWDEGTVTKEPTATEAGVKTFTCTVCQSTKTEEIAATGTTEPTHTHSWSSEWKYDDNYHWHECTTDGCDVKDNSGKNGYAAHTWDGGVVTKEATTTEKGLMTFTCTVCKGTKTQEIPMLEHQHSWSENWTMNDQFHWHDCTAQDCTETDNSQKDGFGAHSWDKGKVIKEATTSAAGTMEYKCSVCGFVKTEQIPILPTPQHDHVWSSAWTYNNTHHWHECTASGCTISNAADKYGYAPHSFGAWRTVKEATATTEGLMEHQCQCGYKESKTIPVKTQTQCSHNWSGWTFNYPNYWERTCSICHSRDIRVTQVAQPKITSGANAVWRQGSSNGLSFTSDAPVSEFKSVTLNGFTLNSSYYTVTEGSTIVTLKKSCLDQLGVGTHRLGIVSSGGTAETTFTVKSKTILNNQTPTYNSSRPWTTPKTGDSANMGLWIGMIAVCAVGLGGVALYVVKFKKNKRN